MDQDLVFIGKIIALEPIPNADFIASATVICGKGGQWKGVVRKADFDLNSLCIVYLPDAQIPPSEDMKFMEATNWRVRMRRFKGSPSEVVIMPPPQSKTTSITWDLQIGWDVTSFLCVTKYHKPIPIHLQGKAYGDFPSFIPKTDEPNYQSVPELVELLEGQPYYITEKADGSSTTAYKYKGHFGVCSRNWELERDENNGYWKVPLRYNLEEKLPDGIAVQWETCGPGIQGNPMQWDNIQGLLFSAYNITQNRYLDFVELCALSQALDFPMVMILKTGQLFSPIVIELMGEGNYDKECQKNIIRF